MLSSLMVPRPPDRNQRGADGLAELSVERLGAQGDGIAECDGEPVFLPFTVATASARGSALAEAEAARAGSSNGWTLGMGAPMRLAHISAVAAAAHYSISMRLPIWLSSSAR